MSDIIKGGPGAEIANAGYDHLRLEVEHRAVLPDGSEVTLPRGTMLYMHMPQVGYTQIGGGAFRRESR